MSSSVSPSLAPSALVAYRVACRRACAIVVADTSRPCPASKGVQPIAELNVVNGELEGG
jgi:hypothetical protein